jgi:hypothetical protein
VNNIDNSRLCIIHIVIATVFCRWIRSDVCSEFALIYGRSFSGENAPRKESVEARTNIVTSDRNLLAIGLVRYAIDFLKVVGIGDDLVTGDDILKTCC